MDIDDCFYDELSSFMSSPNDYGINHDFDEIISSTVSHLDSSLDLNTFLPQSPEISLQSDHLFPDLFQRSPESHNDLELNLDNLSAPTQSLNVDQISLASTMKDSESVSNISDDNTEMENLTCSNILEHIQDRDTPSPTDSCGSFSGSSTSGVHSDTSDAWQNRQPDQNYMAPALFSVSQFPMPYIQRLPVKNDDSIQKSQLPSPVKNEDIIEKSVTNLTMAPKPSLGIKNVVATAPIPVNVDTSVPSKFEKPSREKLHADPPLGVVGKTKTIFLSTNDYKALMDKINLNGSKGAKINGNVKTHIPKIVMKSGNSNVKCHKYVVDKSCAGDAQSPPGPASQDQLLHSNIKSDIAIEPEPSNYNFRSTIEEKMYKKQQRMIKNRQSASMSRKKKKEYVVSLETRLNNLEKENYSLKGENLSLRNQLVALAKTCKCRKGSVCEFVLHSLSTTNRPDQHVKIAPRPTSKSFKQHMNAATVKKNIAVLFAMAFMVTLNAGNFQSYLTNQNLDVDTSSVVSDSNVNEPIPIGRRLLWVESEEEYNEKLNQSNRQKEELAMPPLHFLRPISRSSNVKKNDDWNSTAPARFNRGNYPPPLSYPSPPKCNGSCGSFNSSVNQSEYSRLTFNLEKLINSSGYLKLNMNGKYNIERDTGFKFSTDYLELTDMQRQPSNLGKRKSFLGYKESLPDIEHKQRKMDIISNNKNTHNTSEPINLFKGIKRQGDTFYFLSFNSDHVLLSPSTSTFNKSSRPKMSFLLPTAEPSPNGDLMMMQVDCEVFNTKEVELKSHMIPAGLRPNITKWQFKSKQSLNTNNRTLVTNKLLDKSIKQEKPRVRTYFMVGPKNQAAAAVSQEKPRLVELDKSIVNNSSVLTAGFDSRLNG